jgi:hypothetical protein
VGPGQCKKFPFEWDPGTIYDDLEHTIFRKNAYMWDQSWFMTLLTWQKCLHVGPVKFYDDLEHSTFEKMLTCGTQLNFMMTWNALTCGTKVGL